MEVHPRGKKEKKKESARAFLPIMEAAPLAAAAADLHNNTQKFPPGMSQGCTTVPLPPGSAWSGLTTRPGLLRRRALMTSAFEPWRSRSMLM